MKKQFIVQPKNQIKAAYGVYELGGSIGQNDTDQPRRSFGQAGVGRLVKTFDTADEAKEYAARCRKRLSKGEREYYRMGYRVAPIKDDVKAATNYKLIDKIVKDYEDDYVKGKPLSKIWSEIAKKHHDSKLAADVVAELEKTNKKVDYYDEDAERDPNFIKDRVGKKEIESGCDKQKVEASDPDDDEGEAPKRCKKCGRRLNDGGTCPVCDDGVEERFADGVDDEEDIEGCDVNSASAFQLAGLSTEAESIADNLEEWMNAFLAVPDADGHLSEDDLQILNEAYDILLFAAQSLRGSDEIL